jgi:hypothetical protein
MQTRPGVVKSSMHWKKVCELITADDIVIRETHIREVANCLKAIIWPTTDGIDAPPFFDVWVQSGLA